MTWPFVKNTSMPHAPRGGGAIGTSNGGKPEKKEMPYSPPKGPKGMYDKKVTTHCVQGKH